MARLLVFDRTASKLGAVWSSGSILYRALRRVDAAFGATSWREALEWVETHDVIDELQFWGHGKWGCALIDRDVLDARSIPRLAGLKERLAPNALVWFRTCETFGAARGIDFAERLSDFLGARVAGHTFVIGFHQSGLHGIAPGARADWSATEGLAEGTPDSPKLAKWSSPFGPRTITCLAGRVPEAWFANAG